MPYIHILKELVRRTPRAVGAILIDWEGEAVQEYCHCSPYDMRFTAAHQAIILDRLRNLPGSGESTGRIRDFTMTSDRVHLIIGCIDDEYSLMMSVERACPLQLALHHFRHTVAALRKEI